MLQTLRTYLRCRCKMHEMLDLGSWPFVDIFSYSIEDDKVKIYPNDEKNIYNIDADDVWWSASDIGWIVGHSYIVYAPLFKGCTTVLFEGKPVGTPDAGAFWKIISDYKVKSLFTAPTAFRAIKKEDPEGKFFSKDTQRMENTTERLKQLEIIPNRWKATHYNTSECQEDYKKYLKLPENIIEKISTRLKLGPFKKISQSELACFMSHIKLWEYLYKKNVKIAIIFEDDIIFSKDLRKQDIIDTIENSKGFNIIWLGHCNDLSPIKVTQPGTSLCLHAYVVSSFALEKLVNFNSKIEKVDYLVRTFCKKNLCFKVGHKPNKDVDTFGYGIIHQDNMYISNIQKKK